MSMPLISVVVPIYRVEKYLSKCIESIVNQTYKNLEILLVNDGSPDNSKAICEKYKKKDSRIIIINKDNGGLASARNAALKVAKGEFIVCVDSDDWIECTMVEKLYENMCDYNADLSVCSFYDEFDIPQKSCRKYSGEVQVLDTEKAMEYAILPKKYYGFAWNKMYKKSIMGDLMYDESILKGEDSPFTCEYISNCKNVVYQDIPLYHYRQDSVSISRSLFSKKKMTVLDSYMGIVDLLEKKKYSQRIIEMQKVQYANQLLSLQVNIVNTGRERFEEEYNYIKREMRDYKKIYMKSEDIDKIHKITYICGMNSYYILKLLCWCKSKL